MTFYICTACGYGTSSWIGKCPSCNSWNTFEMKKEKSHTTKKKVQQLRVVDLKDIHIDSSKRMPTALSEFNRVLGAGFVKGEVVLLTGEPGVGKSTLLLQGLQHLNTLYISGEESAQQVKERTDRLGINMDSIQFSDTLEVDGIIHGVQKLKQKIDILVVDSIQTVYSENLDAPYGNIVQLKESSSKLISFAKEHYIVVILIGHITKGGDIAGPKTLEHMVDAVLHIEGDRNSQVRILRSKKNRFGSTDEIGMFEMKKKGLSNVTNPGLFSDESSSLTVPGKAYVGIVEGKRPLYLEIQILATKTFQAIPRRVVKGMDYNKFLLLLAVAQKHMSLFHDKYDIYANVMGGIQINSPAADLGILTAVYSSLYNKAIRNSIVFIGEVGLLGEVRSIPGEDRLKSDASRFGFSSVLSSSEIKHVKKLPEMINLPK